MDSACRALSHTFLAELALGVVNVSKIVLDHNSSERADLGALAAADAGSLACLAGNSTLVLVHA